MRTAGVLVRHELRMFVSLALWVARRSHATSGGRAFGYARGQGAVMFGLAFVGVVETLTMSVLLRDYPTVHGVVLVLDVYAVVLVVGLHAANVVRPHVLEPDELRVRRAVHVDLRIPLERIASVRRELRSVGAVQEGTDGELDLAMGAQTSVTLELDEPVTHLTFLGRRREVSVVRFHADDADRLVQAVRQARSARSPLPDRPV
ncbi:hypothetical protein SALBM311S_03877 [Streptomyces alboniger]